MKELWKSFLVSFITSLLVSVGIIFLLFFLMIYPFFASQGKLPNLKGLTLEEALKIADSMNFTIVVKGKVPSDYAEGVIAEQIPEPGDKYRKGEKIKVYLSKGRPSAIIPDVLGLEISEATSVLQDSGFFIEDIVSMYDTLREGLCIKTEPPAGEKLEKGKGVRLFVSLGPEIVKVPNVKGKKLSLAKDIITSAGLTVGKIRYRISTEYYKGVVISQSPKPGTEVKKGTKVNLIVATVIE